MCKKSCRTYFAHLPRCAACAQSKYITRILFLFWSIAAIQFAFISTVFAQETSVSQQSTIPAVIPTQPSPPPINPAITPTEASPSSIISAVIPTQSSPPTVPQPIPMNQFQQWLQNNGYAQNQASNASSNKVDVIKPQLTYEQGQKVMLKSVPPSNMVPTPDANIAFNMMMQQNMPMSPQQVIRLRQQIDTAQLAAAVPPNIPPKPVSTTLMINLAPGTTPPAVRLSQGYVSSLVFVDSTGSPWPIAAFDIGNPKALNVQWDGKSNILLLQAVSPYSNGDIVLRLVGLATPVTLQLVAGQRVVDYRVDIHVAGLGPNTKDLPIGTPLPNSANQLLLGVLDGVAPPGSKQLTVLGADAQAWLIGETLYLRTRLTLLSPGWMGKMVSPDGMQAYELPRTSSVLISRYGEPAELKIEGF